MYRLEALVISQTFPEKPNLDVTGLSDLIILDVVVFKQDWGHIVVCLGLIIPTATDPAIGSAK